MITQGEEVITFLRLAVDSRLSLADAKKVVQWLRKKAAEERSCSTVPTDGNAIMAEALLYLADAFNHVENQVRWRASSRSN